MGREEEKEREEEEEEGLFLYSMDQYEWRKNQDSFLNRWSLKVDVLVLKQHIRNPNCSCLYQLCAVNLLLAALWAHLWEITYSRSIKIVKT